MPSRKPSSGQSSRYRYLRTQEKGQSLASFRHDVARLKEKGLVSQKVNPRKQRMTTYMKGQVQKFRDVLSGKSQAVHTPTRKEARAFSDKFKVKGKTVVIPRDRGETIRYSKKNKEFIGTRYIGDKKITRRFVSEKDARKIKEKPNQFFQVSFASGKKSWKFEHFSDLEIFMNPYEQGRSFTWTDKYGQVHVSNPYYDWQNYVEIVEVH